jgi:hypothetical protein
VPDEDVVCYDGNGWSTRFSGADAGLNGSNGQNIDAFDLPPQQQGAAPPAQLMLLAVRANTPVPGVSAPGDDADVYSWDGNGFARAFDARATGSNLLPGNADINALDLS